MKEESKGTALTHRWQTRKLTNEEYLREGKQYTHQQLKELNRYLTFRWRIEMIIWGFFGVFLLIGERILFFSFDFLFLTLSEGLFYFDFSLISSFFSTFHIPLFKYRCSFLPLTPKQLEETNLSHNTPLHIACETPIEECFSLFLSTTNLSIEMLAATNSKGETPLHVCSQTSFSRSLHLLSAFSDFIFTSQIEHKLFHFHSSSHLTAIESLFLAWNYSFYSSSTQETYDPSLYGETSSHTSSSSKLYEGIHYNRSLLVLKRGMTTYCNVNLFPLLLSVVSFHPQFLSQSDLFHIYYHTCKLSSSYSHLSPSSPHLSPNREIFLTPNKDPLLLHRTFKKGWINQSQLKIFDLYRTFPKSLFGTENLCYPQMSQPKTPHDLQVEYSDHILMYIHHPEITEWIINLMGCPIVIDNFDLRVEKVRQLLKEHLLLTSRISRSLLLQNSLFLWQRYRVWLLSDEQRSLLTSLFSLSEVNLPYFEGKVVEVLLTSSRTPSSLMFSSPLPLVFPLLYVDDMQTHNLPTLPYDCSVSRHYIVYVWSHQTTQKLFPSHSSHTLNTLSLPLHVFSQTNQPPSHPPPPPFPLTLLSSKTDVCECETHSPSCITHHITLHPTQTVTSQDITIEIHTTERVFLRMCAPLTHYRLGLARRISDFSL
jgi:hypothetical protein